ncbi:MAG: hypothetical protein K9L22_03800 [Methylococcaceae bacterium]|nr:hypothetical protein [Methylococcaceae bacterium]
MKNQQFEDFKNFINESPNFSVNSPLSEALLLKKEGKVSVYYSPFEYVNVNAKIVLVGITPGHQQAVNALNVAKNGLDNNNSTDEILKSVKSSASFSGPMRKNLINMLDDIGLNKKLNITSTDQLFTTHSHLVQMASILKNPVFVDGKNYSGSPSMLKSPVLRELINDFFVAEICNKLKNPLFISLSPKVTAALEWLASENIISNDQILSGIPHPSGANAERIAYFLGNKPKDQLSAKTNPETIDKNKQDLLLKIGVIGNN